jgi:hypothetical protein
VLQEWQTRTFRQEVSFFGISKVGADNGLDFSDPATEKSQTKITNDIRIVSQQWGLTSVYGSCAAYQKGSLSGQPMNTDGWQ